MNNVGAKAPCETVRVYTKGLHSRPLISTPHVLWRVVKVARFNTQTEAAYHPSFSQRFTGRARSVYRRSRNFRIFASRVAHMSMYRTSQVAFLAFSTFVQGATSASNFAASPQAAEARSSPERVVADTPRVTPGGASFMVPSGWSIVTGKNLVILEPPETDTHIAIVESQAADARAAVAAGWAVYKPETERPLKLVTPRPAREGWDDRQVFDYETSPNERAVVQALALRAGSRWTAVILDGSEPTVEKRSAPIGLIFESLRPKGYQRESFAGRKPQPLDTAHIAQI
jgi:hypothetical protein